MEKINRREFIRKSAVAGAASIFGGSILSSHGLLHAAGQIDLSVVKGQNYFKNTVKAVEQLGGMRKFVCKGRNSCQHPFYKSRYPYKPRYCPCHCEDVF